MRDVSEVRSRMRGLVLGVVTLGLAACSEEVGQRREPAKAPPQVGASRQAAPSGASTSTTPAMPVVTGSLAVAPGLVVPARATLFITARGAAGGPPVLVKKVDAPTFPYAFVLSTADMMMQGMPLPESLTVVARLDQDGDAISRTPGDLVAKLEAPVKSGASGVELVFREALGAP